MCLHHVAITQGSEPSPRARMSVSLNETTKTAWFYGGRTESTEQSSDYVNRKSSTENDQIPTLLYIV